MYLNETSDEINYVIGGSGTAFCGGKAFGGRMSRCCYSIVNNEDEDFVLFTSVSER